LSDALKKVKKKAVVGSAIVKTKAVEGSKIVKAKAIETNRQVKDSKLYAAAKKNAAIAATKTKVAVSKATAQTMAVAQKAKTQIQNMRGWMASSPIFLTCRKRRNPRISFFAAINHRTPASRQCHSPGNADFWSSVGRSSQKISQAESICPRHSDKMHCPLENKRYMPALSF
jgi:hypothetical protein